MSSDTRYIDGSVMQSSHASDFNDNKDERMYFPVLGIVLNVYAPDDPNNKSAILSSNFRGSIWEADVLVINDGKEGGSMIPHVMIAPSGPSGINEFTQDIPRGTTQMLDGSFLKTSLANMNPNKLDGDRCLVQFIGGKITQPVMTSWMPHPENTYDPSTAGFAEGHINQGTPHLARRKGTTFTVTDQGSLFINTSAANSTIVGEDTGPRREEEIVGGDVQVDMKAGAAFGVNFNQSINSSDDEPSLIQPNPPPSIVAGYEREVDKSSFYMDEDFIEAVAGKVVRLIANDGDIMLSPSENLFLGDQASDENMVLGQAWKTKVTNTINALLGHIHPTSLGPSGTMAEPVPSLLQLELDNIDESLSDYIFGSKEAPEIYDGDVKYDDMYEGDPNVDDG